MNNNHYRSIKSRIEPQFKQIDEYKVYREKINIIDKIANQQSNDGKQLNYVSKLIDKFKEYNQIIDNNKRKLLKSNVPPLDTSKFKRYHGDNGNITNYHIVLNYQNLNPLFKELSNKSLSFYHEKKKKQSYLQSTFVSSQSIHQQINQNIQDINNDFYNINSVQISPNTSRSKLLQAISQRKSNMSSNVLDNSFNNSQIKDSDDNNTSRDGEPLAVSQFEFHSQKICPNLINKNISNYPNFVNDSSIHTREQAAHENQQKEKKSISLSKKMGQQEKLDEENRIMIQSTDRRNALQNTYQYVDDFQIQFGNKNPQAVVQAQQKYKKYISRKQPKYFHPRTGKNIVKFTPQNQILFNHVSNQKGQNMSSQLNELEKEFDCGNIRILDGPPLPMEKSLYCEEEFLDRKIRMMMKKFNKQNYN